jgi:hypothetical protein
MRFLVTVKMREDVGPPPPELAEAMGRGMEEMFASGVMLDAGGLFPTAVSTEIRVAQGEVFVTDGPYAEAKEVAGGYSILQAASSEEAVRLARRVAEIHRKFWPGWEGAVEVRQIAEPQPEAPATPGPAAPGA